MRPRRARLGCRLSRSSPTAASVNFNEAEARAPRMRERRANGARRCARYFNEAEARAPRMPSSSAPTGANSRHFNEAEARAPRMPIGADSLPSCSATTSMRPRRARLGCRERRSRSSVDADRTSMRPRRARLGCASDGPTRRRLDARDFNEAEARAPRMHVDRATRQIASRRDFNEAEARAPRMPSRRAAEHGAERRTSMRPRRARLGCRAVGAPTSRGSRRTSMRPRRARLGCLRARHGRLASATRLQ